MWISGVLDFSWWQIIIATLILTHISVISVTIYLHRYSAHRALDLHPALQHFFRFWLWLTTAMNTKEWTAVHRKHHAKCETEEDPHSPVIHGLAKVLFNGLGLYRRAAHDSAVLKKYGQGTPDDWLEHHVYTKHDAKWGISILLVIDLLLFGVFGLAVWAVQMLWMPFFAAGVVNGIGHHTGYRNFECPDAARNVVPIGVLLGGEELHNNHHTYPNSPKLSVKWWEFDMGWFWIRLFSFFGLAKVRHTKPIAYRVSGKLAIDNETAQAVVNNRFQIMAQYRKKVIAPIIKREKAKAGDEVKPLFRRAQKLLTREQSIISDRAKQRIKTLCEQNNSMAIAYTKYQELQAIWKKTAANKDEKLKALKEWCKQAEESGIKKLQDFAALLRSYSLQPSTM